jgi:hypothetical protein
MEMNFKHKYYIELSGGLGNQLFQVAQVYHLMKMGLRIKLDPIQFLAGNSTRKVLVKEVVNELSIEYRNYSGISKLILKNPYIYSRYIKYLRNSSYQMENSHTNVHPDLLIHETRILGYFQNIQYIDPIIRVLKKRLNPNGTNDAIAIHLRWGDYMKKEHSSHGILQEEYYHKSIELIKEKYGKKLIRIYTDSHEEIIQEDWVIQLLNEGAQIVKLNDPWESMLDMANNSFIVTANSTFSWWAAALGEKHLIVLPRKWYTNYSLPDALYIPNSYVI